MPGTTLANFLCRIQEVFGRRRKMAVDYLRSGNNPNAIAENTTVQTTDPGFRDTLLSSINRYQRHNGTVMLQDTEDSGSETRRQTKTPKPASTAECPKKEVNEAAECSRMSTKDGYILSPKSNGECIHTMEVNGLKSEATECIDGDMVVFGAVEADDGSLLCILCAYAKSVEDCHNIFKLCNVITEVM